MEPYEGREPYIFISYARKDAERVTPYLEALTGAGWRVWWDRGIQAGEHWTETLVEKVENCAVFCPLFSEAFSDSRFCFEETDYAYRKDKPIVPLYLDAPKPDGLRPLYRLLQARQDVRLYEYPDAAQFAERLGRELAFASCKAPEWNKIGEIQWRFSESDGVLTIARNEDLPNYYKYGSIPSYQSDPTHGGSTAPWMSRRKQILSVEIADDIDEIGGFAFRGCASLTTVRIGERVTQIGDSAFWGCKSLTTVRIPDSVTKIGNFAFSLCASLTTLRIGDRVTQIGENAFAHCKSLTTVRIPDGVTQIGVRAFEGCESLTTVRIPDGVTQIGDDAFGFCKRLTDVRIPDGVTQIGGYAFAGCESLTTVRIPDGVTQIGDNAFEGCASLTTVRIPDSVTQIGDFAFEGCESLTTVRIGDGVTQIGDGAFEGCVSLKSVEIPAGVKVGKYAFPEHTRVIRRAAPGQ